MSSSSSSAPSSKPERSSSFSFGKLRSSLRRNSKQSVSGSPEPSEGRQSPESNASSTKPAGTSSAPNSPGKAPSIRKSLEQGRPTRHGRSSSLSIVAQPPAEGDKPADFDPFAESHDTDKSKSRTWSVRKTVKGALRRTASRLSVSSVTSVTKPAAATEAHVTTDVVSDEPDALKPTNSTSVTPPPVYSSHLEPSPPTDAEPPALASEEPTEAPAAPTTPEPVVIAQPIQEVPPPTEVEQEDKAAAQELELVSSQASLDWEHIEIEPTPITAVTSDAQWTDQAGEDVVVHEVVTVETTSTPNVPAIVEPETKQSESKGLSPLDVGSIAPRQLLNASHLRSEITELSPILESPLTTRDEKRPFSFEVPSSPGHVLVLAETPVTATSETSSSPFNPPPIDTTVLTPHSEAREASTPNLNAIELGVAPPSASKEQADAKDASINHFALDGPSNTNANATETNVQAEDLNSYGLIANTAWFVGACVVVGIGMIVGQVRSYRQVYRSSIISPVKRWFSFDWWKI